MSRQCILTYTRHSFVAIRHPVTRLNLHHAFSTSKCLAKGKNKAGKAAKEEKQASSKPGSEPSSDDPYDFTTLEADIANALEKLKNDLSKLRAGGRFNPEVMENLRVQPDKNSDQTVRLSDVAQVIPKGRTVQVLVGEKDVRIPRLERGNLRTADYLDSTSKQSPRLSNPPRSPSHLNPIPQAQTHSCW